MMLRRAIPLVLALAVAGCGGAGSDGNGNGKGGADEEKRADLAALKERLGAQAEVAEDAGCTIETPKQLGTDHVDDVSDVQYSSSPPSSGPHYPDWAPFGFYDEPVEDGFVVHNLEHGGVALWYGDDALDGDRLTLVRDDVLDEGEKWLVTPREDLDGIAAAAWGMLLTCPPEALDVLEDQQLRELLDAWYEATHSRGTEQEKDVPAYAGAMSEPQPVRDISLDPPESFGDNL